MSELAKAAEASKVKQPKWDNLDVEIAHQGRAITLPADPTDMPIDKAIEALMRKKADLDQPFEVSEIIDAYPHDAAVAFVKGMTNLYGWASPQSVMTIFGPRPPAMLSVKTGHRDDDVVQCPLGAFKLPGVDEQIHTMIQNGHFMVVATVKKRNKHLVLELITEARRIVREESIYRGKAIRLFVDEDGDLETANPPTFINTAGTDPLIFDADIQAQINQYVLGPIMYAKDCRAINTPLRRGVLLEGPYGTGKSLTARMISAVCEANGWTFVLLDRVQGLKAALEFAKRYEPAVVFAEDIDRIAAERDDKTNDLINIIDGVISKTCEVMTILTTNFAEKLDKVILRPGRLDAIISLRAPSRDGVERLLRHYAGNLLPATADVAGAARELAGQIPASIRECVERAKLGMVWRRDHILADDDLVVAAKTMKGHLALLNQETKKPTPAEVLADSLHQVVAHGSKDVEQSVVSAERNLSEQIDGVYGEAESANARANRIRRELESLTVMVNERLPN